MKALAVLIFAVFMSAIVTVTMASHSAQPASRGVGFVAVSTEDLALRSHVEASRWMLRKPLFPHRTTRRARTVDEVPVTDSVVITSPSLIQRYALSLVGPAQFACLQPLWERESRWDPNASNASGASGIAQLMPGTWEDLGLTPTSDPRRQVDAGLAYVHARYGSPCAAWAFWEQHDWY